MWITRVDTMETRAALAPSTARTTWTWARMLMGIALILREWSGFQRTGRWAAALPRCQVWEAWAPLTISRDSRFHGWRVTGDIPKTDLQVIYISLNFAAVFPCFIWICVLIRNSLYKGFHRVVIISAIQWSKRSKNIVGLILITSFTQQLHFLNLCYF